MLIIFLFPFYSPYIELNDELKKEIKELKHLPGENLLEERGEQKTGDFSPSLNKSEKD